MEFSRYIFDRYQSAVMAGGVVSLIIANRKKSSLKNRVEEATAYAEVAFFLELPAFSQMRSSNELRRRGIFTSPSDMRSVGAIFG